MHTLTSRGRPRYIYMMPSKKDIITHLRKEILILEGLGVQSQDRIMDLGLNFMTDAFVEKSFPLSAVHEWISEGPECSAATAGFTAGLLSGLLKNGGAAVWISPSQTIFPTTLKIFGMNPDQIIFIRLRKEKDLNWAMEEALKCTGLAVVICELTELSFTSSRRFQLAVEQSKTTGLILRTNPKTITPNSCIARWQVKPLPSFSEKGMPGLGNSRWQVDLLKIRNGKPGSWIIEWSGGRFREVKESIPSILLHSTRKIG